MPDTTNTKSDLEILTQLNADFLASTLNGDVRRFEQILAEDFMVSLPDFLLRDKKQFLDMMAAPRPFTELKSGRGENSVTGRFRDYPCTHDLPNGRWCTTSGTIH